MKKTYQTPVIDIEKFDIVDVITDSAATTSVSISTSDANSDGTTAAATVEW